MTGFNKEDVREFVRLFDCHPIRFLHARLSAENKRQVIDLHHLKLHFNRETPYKYHFPAGSKELLARMSIKEKVRKKFWGNGDWANQY